jgi:hypothetical protein
VAANLSIDPKLIERALEVSGERTKKAAATKALEELIAPWRQERLLELMGKLEWDRFLSITRKNALAREPLRGHEHLVVRAPTRLAGTVSAVRVPTERNMT